MKPQVAEAFEKAKGRPLPYPYWLNIENTLRCNLSCPMCLQHITGTTRSGIDMDLDLFKKIAEEIFPHTQRVCWSVAGEPMLAPHFLAFLDIANAYPIKTEIITNATLLHRGKTLEKLLPTLDIFQVSLDGATQKTYEKIRVGGKWSQVIANLRTFQKVRMSLPAARRPRFNLSVILMVQNIHELPLFVDFARDLGADGVEANHMLVFSPDLERESLLSAKARANKFFDAARARGEKAGIGVFLPPNYPLGDGPREEEPGPDTPERLDLPPEPEPKPGVVPLSSTVISRLQKRPLVERVRAAVFSRDHRLKKLEARRQRGIRGWEAATGLKNRCDYLWGKAYISAGGDVAPCCMPGRPLVGNVRDKTFYEVWNGEALMKMRAHLSGGDPYDCCLHCSLFRDTMDPGDEKIWLKQSADVRAFKEPV